MKKKWTNNWGIKILSLGLAVILWIVIVNVDDPAKTKTISNVEVQLLNRESIESSNQVFEVIEGATVDIKVKGNKSQIDKLKASDLKVTADLVNINANGSVKINAECTKYPLVDVELSKAQYLKVSIENVKTAQFVVQIIQKGSEAEGYSVDELKAKPNIIEVSGAESQIDRIEKIVVEANLNNLDKDYSERLEPIAYDKENKVISSDKLNFSTAFVLVTAKVLPTKVVPINLIVKGEAASGYRFIKMEYEPKEVEIVAKQSVLDSIKNIEIEIDIEGATATTEIEKNVLDYLEKANVANESDQTLIANVIIEKLETKDITFSAKDIEVKNLPEEMQFNFSQSDATYTIQIMGLKAEIADMTIEDLLAYIDLAKQNVGIQEVEVKFDNSLEIEYVTIAKISIELVDLNAILQPGETVSPTATVEPTVSTAPTTSVTPEPAATSAVTQVPQ